VKALQFIQPIIILNNIIIKNGTKEIVWLMTESMHLITLKIKQKMLMDKFGLPISQNSEWDQEE